MYIVPDQHMHFSLLINGGEAWGGGNQGQLTRMNNL